MWKVALKGLSQRKRRLLSTMVAIVLGVGFITGVFVLSDTIGRTFDSLFASVYKGTDAVVSVKDQLGGGFRRAPKRLSAALVAAVKHADGVADAQGFVQSYAQVIDAKGTPIGGSNSPTFGSAWLTNLALNPFTVAEGHAPSSPDEIDVDRNTAKLGKFHTGDVVRVLTTSETKSYTIVGITRFGSADSPAGISFVHFTAAEADRIYETKGAVDQILVVAAPGVSQDQLKANLAPVVAAIDPRAEVLTGDQATIARQSTFKDRLKGFTTFLLIFAIIALVVATFVIFNTFQILLAQRLRELALLRAIGAGAGQVLRSVLLESLVIATVASVIGIGAGVVIALVLKALFSSFGIPLPDGSLVLAQRTIVIGFVVGLIATMIASALPAWRAARVAPIAALQESAAEQRRASKLRIAFGIVVILAAAFLLVRGIRGTGNGALYATGISAGLTIVGVRLLDPVLLIPFSRFIGLGLKRRGVSGQLATENVVRSPRRNGLTAFPLLFGAALVGLLLVFAASFRAQVDKTIQGQFKGDFLVTTKTFIGGFPPSLAKQLATVPGVKTLTPLRFTPAEIIDRKTGKPGDEGLVAVDPATVLETVDIPTTAGSITDLTLGTVGLAQKYADEQHIALGDTVQIEFAKGEPVPLRVAALINGDKIIGLFQGTTTLIGIDTFDANVDQHVDNAIYIKALPKTDVSALRAALIEAAKSTPTADIGDLASYKKLVDKQISPFLYFIIALLAISVVIAVVGVANTMKLSVAERTREIGVLRAVGMDRGQSRAMVRWEAITISVFGAVLGAGIGAGFGVAVMRALASQGFTERVIPVRQFILMAVIAAVLGLIAASGAARRVAKLDVLQAIAVE